MSVDIREFERHAALRFDIATRRRRDNQGPFLRRHTHG